MDLLKGLDLFSGIGGISKALEPWVQTVAYCEQDRFCQGVLLSRMQSDDLIRAPIWDDVSTLSGGMLPRIDIIFGGFPCQDISVAGHGKGLEGERSGLFFEIVRLVGELRPSFVFLENVPAITGRGLDRVLGELVTLGYDCRWGILSAAEVGALHKRERWFLLAYSSSKRGGRGKEPEGEGEKVAYRSAEDAHSNSERGTSQEHGDKGQSEAVQEREDTQHRADGLCSSDTDAVSVGQSEGSVEGIRPEEQETRRENASDVCEEATDTGGERLERQGQRGGHEETLSFPCLDLDTEQWQEAVSEICRTADGVPDYVARIKCLGNSVVCSQVREAFKLLMGVPRI